MAAQQSLASLRELSRTFDAVSQSLISRSSQKLHQFHDNLHTALVAVHHTTSALSDWPHPSSSVKASLTAKLVMQAHCDSITSYSAFVQAVLAFEHTITPDPGLHKRAYSARSVSALLTIPMTIFTDLPSSWPTSRYLLCNPPLYAALNALAAYFLTRKLKTDPAIGMAVSAQHVVTPALLLLHTTSVCLNPLHSLFDSAVLAALPSGFINRIFCVACEELGPYLSDKMALLATDSHWMELSNLLSLVVYCVHKANGTASFARLCNLLLGPGTLEAGRMLKLAYCSEALQADEKMSHASKDLQLLLVWCGSQFLLANNESAERFLQVLDASSAAGSHTQNFLRCMSDSGTRSLFANTAGSSGSGEQLTANQVAPRVKVTDEHLTFVLCAQSRSDPSTMVENTRLIHLMWMHSIAEQSFGSMQLPMKLHSAGELLGIANHCTHQVLLWLRDQQRTKTEARSCQPELEVTQGSAQAANPLSMSSTRGTKLGILELRSLMVCSSKEGKMKEKPGDNAMPRLSKLDLRADVRRWIWQSMPGSLMTMEALMRQEDCVLTSEQLCFAMMANEQLLLQASPSSLPTYLSLVSTIRKHTAMYVKAVRADSEDGTEAELMNSMEEGLMLARFEGCLGALLKSLLFCEDCGGKLCKSEDADNNSGSSRSVACKNSIHNMYQSSSVSSAAALSPSSSPETASSPIAAFFSDMDRLRAIVAVTLTHMHGLICWEGPNGEQDMQPSWVTDLLPHAEPYLALLIQTILTPPKERQYDCQRMGVGLINASIWQKYVMRSFQGRLLAGCCHLGCKNMGGCSEGTLPTLLCGGCRRARYCSTECQQEAWIKGMHKYACGNQIGEAKLDSSGKACFSGYRVDIHS